MHFFPSSESIIKFFETNAPQYLSAYHKCETLQEQFDFARYVILYCLGGISVDIAVTRPLERLDVLVHDLNPHQSKEQLIAAVDYDFETLHDSKVWAYPRQYGLATHVWAVTPQHPTLLKIIELVNYNLHSREEIDQAILHHGYPSNVLQHSKKATLLRRMWTTGTGPFSDVILQAVEDQRQKEPPNLHDEVTDSNRNNSHPYHLSDSKKAGAADDTSSHEVIVLPMETFMAAHPGGMRFRNIQHSRDHSHLIYMGDDDDSASVQRKGEDTRLSNNILSGTKEGNEEESKTKGDVAADPHFAEPSQHEHGGSPANLNPKQKESLGKTFAAKFATMNIMNHKKKNKTNGSDSSSIRWKNYLVYDESHLPTDTHHAVAPYTYLIGAVRDASQIADTPFRYIVQLSCEHGVHVHIVVGGGVEECRARFEKAAKDRYSPAQRARCGR